MAAQVLREYRRMHGLSQSELADKLDVSRQLIAKIEAGRGNVEATKARAWAKALRVKPGDLRPDVFGSK